MKARVAKALGCVLFSMSMAAADVVVLQDKDDWFALVDTAETIDFTGFPDGTPITTQYAGHGIVFTDQNDFVDFRKSIYPNDGVGLYGGSAEGRCHVESDFRAPQFWFAVEYPGTLVVRLYHGDNQLYESRELGERGPGNFLGLVSDEPFDRLELDGAGHVTIDDLHFGPAICVADLDGDARVGFEDLVLVLSAWGSEEGPEDLDMNGIVDLDDLLALLSAWGPCQ